MVCQNYKAASLAISTGMPSRERNMACLNYNTACLHENTPLLPKVRVSFGMDQNDRFPTLYYSTRNEEYSYYSKRGSVG